MRMDISDRWTYRLWSIISLFFFALLGVIVLMILFKAALKTEWQGFLALIPYWVLVTVFIGLDIVFIIGLLRSNFYHGLLKVGMPKRYYVWVDKFPLEARIFFGSWRLKNRDEKAQFLREWYEHLFEVAQNYVPPDDWGPLKKGLEEVALQLDRAMKFLLAGDDFQARVWLHKAERAGSAAKDMCTKLDEAAAEGGAA